MPWGPIAEPGPALPSPTPFSPLGLAGQLPNKVPRHQGMGPWRGQESFCPGPRSVHTEATRTAGCVRPAVPAPPPPQGRSAVWGEISCSSSAPQSFPLFRQERAPPCRHGHSDLDRTQRSGPRATSPPRACVSLLWQQEEGVSNPQGGPRQAQRPAAPEGEEESLAPARLCCAHIGSWGGGGRGRNPSH